MQVLFVTPYPPSHIRVRSYGFVHQLAQHHTVTVLALCTSERELTEALALRRSGITITPVWEPSYRPYLRSLRALATPLPLQVAFGAAPALRAAIQEQVTSGHVDVLHVEQIRVLGALPDELPIPIIWDAVDCISQLYAEGARAGATFMLRLVGAMEARRVRAYERLQLHRFRHVLVTSERDRQALLDLASESQIAEITVLPHGIDQHYFQPYTGPRQPQTLIFSGKMSFHANVAGAMTLVERIMPLLWAQRPDIRLIIAGSNPPRKVRRLARDPRIQVTGYVPDLRPFIAQAQVAVSPLPYAVGIQNKVLEAMALGTPVVASSCAIAGLQATSGLDVLVADEPESFAAAVLRLLDDQVLWQRLAERGPAYVARYHNWEDIVRRLTAVYTRSLGTADITAAKVAWP